MMKGWKSAAYISLALGMLGYAVPRLEIGGGYSPASIFAAVWICFALLIVGAHLHDILGVEEETRERLRQIKRLKRRQTEQKLLGRAWSGRLQ